MTIIASYHRKDVMLMIGDLMVSSGEERDSPIDIPTRFSEFQPTANLFFSGISQKILIINDHLAVAWAGRKIVAKALIQRIADEIATPYSPEQILALISSAGLLDEELNSVSFIFFVQFIDGHDDKLFIQDYLTGETILGDNEKVKYAGSGTYHFFDCIGFEFKGGSGEVNDYEKAVLTFIGRLAIALYEEIVSDITHNFFYGGGFELLLLNPIEKRFYKAPMTFAFWKRDANDIKLLGPVLALNYDNSGFLFLHRISQSAKGGWTLKTYPVGNLLNESVMRVSAPPAPDFNTLLSVHYIVSTDSDKVRMLLKKGNNTNISIKYSPDTESIDVVWSPEFAEDVRCACL